jgi:CHAT domain-containing protein
MDLPVGSFAALQGTAEEARIAARYASASWVIPEFTRADLGSALDRRVDVLHLATHAAFNGRSDRAFIVANGEVIRLSELRDMIGRSGMRGEAIDLIVLSACETAVGDDEASMGLAGAAVQAGARSVIGSLWQVNDAGTAELMRQFYRRYAEGQPRSQALREAQLALIEGGGGNADPNIWAAFALLGAWR